MDISMADMAERLARLETEVARLRARVDAPPPARPAPRVMAPARRPASRPLNPVVLVAAVGALIFLAGAGFFLHLAVQRGWVGPGIRFIAGLAVGGGLAAHARRLFFRNDEALGTCLLGAGTGALLFTLYAGAFRYQFYPPAVGFAAAAGTTVAAGFLAARSRSQAALIVALAVGLVTPLVFATTVPHELSLSVYLATLLAAACAVPYATRTGAAWGLARWVALAGVWLMLAVAALGLPAQDSQVFMGLLVLHYLLAGIWIWLPGQEEPRPAFATGLWIFATLAMAGLLWRGWSGAGLPRQAFALPLLGLALVNLLCVGPVRRRLGGRQADLGLLVLVAIQLVLALPAALDWPWAGCGWCLYAAGSAWTAERARFRPGWEAEARNLAILAAGLSVLASGVWIDQLWLGGGGNALPCLNLAFCDGALAAFAWAGLARWEGLPGRAGFLGLEAVGNVVAARELGLMVRFAGFGRLAEDVTRTLVLAGSGAGQWLASLRSVRPALARGLAGAGYILLGAASLKLLLVDLERASLPLRALVFLGVGGILLGAAMVGRNLRDRTQA